MTTWYFNNEGVAEGPLEEDAMGALCAQGKIAAHTLVTRGDAFEWAEAGKLAPSWWKAVPVPDVPVAVAAPVNKGENAARGLVPNAPAVDPNRPSAKKAGFFKKLFGFGGSKT